MIVNTDDSEHSGTHWVVVYCNSTSLAYYFCPLARFPNKTIEHFLAQFAQVRANVCTFQSRTSKVCGQYCIYMLYWLAKGLDFDAVLEKLTKARNSDALVRRFVQSITRK